MVTLGRILFNVKAQDLIVEAISKLSAEIRRNIHLDIIGDGNINAYMCISSTLHKCQFQ